MSAFCACNLQAWLGVGEERSAVRGNLRLKDLSALEFLIDVF